MLPGFEDMLFTCINILSSKKPNPSLDAVITILVCTTFTIHILSSCFKIQHVLQRSHYKFIIVPCSIITILPLVIRFYTFSDGTSKAKEGLPQNCLIACSFAISQLNAVSWQLQEGDITVMELQKVLAKEEHMKRLCEAASAEPKNEYRSLVQEFSDTLQLRVQEFKSFKEQQGFLIHLCQRIYPQIEGQQISASLHPNITHLTQAEMYIIMHMNMYLSNQSVLYCVVYTHIRESVDSM